MTQNQLVFHQQSVFYQPIKYLLDRGGMFKKGDKFILKKKYHKNIKAYIIGLNKKFFVNQFKNKIKFKYFKHLKKAILTLKNDLKRDPKIKQFYLALLLLPLINSKILRIEVIILII